MTTKNFSLKKALLIVVPLLLVVLVAVRLRNNKATTENKIYQYDKTQPLNVETQKVVLQTIDDAFSYSGVFEPNRESKLSAELQGKINAIYCDAGSIVAQGQKLVQLDAALLQQQLNAVNVQIQNAKAEYEVQLQTNQIQIEALKADVRRFTVLAQNDAIQGIQLEKTQQQLQTAENQRVAILHQSGLKTAEAQKANIEAQINKTSILAPFSGIITAKLSEIGAFAAPGIPLLQLTDIATLKFTINVAESELYQFRTGQTYTIGLDALPDTQLQGRITLIGSKSNMGNSFPVQFMVTNTKASSVKAGMFGKVQIPHSNSQKGIVIPASVVVGSAEQPQVFTVKNGSAALTNITISKRTGDKVVVANGLQEGDIIITNGFINLFEGATIISK